MDILQKELGINFFVHANNCDETANASKGVLVLVNKNYFHVQKEISIFQGCFSQLCLIRKKGDLSSLNILAYYNPKVSDRNLLTRLHSLLNFYLKDAKNTLILGDFNEKLCPFQDYNSYRNKILTNSTVSQDLSLKKIVEENNLYYERSDYTFQRKDVCSSRIDWIFCTDDMKHLYKDLQTSDAPFKTDHKILSVAISNSVVKENNRQVLHDHIIKKPEIASALCDMVKEVVSNNDLDCFTKLEKIIEKSTKICRNEKKKESKKIHNRINQILFQIKHAQDDSCRDKLKRKLSTFLSNVSNVLHWRKISYFLSIVGPCKAYTKKIERSKASNPPKSFKKENGEIVEGKKAADYAKTQLSEWYKKGEIDKDLLMESLKLLPKISMESFKILSEDYDSDKFESSIRQTPHSSPGITGSSATLFQIISEEISPLFIEITNEISENGKAPDILNQGRLIPILKPGKDPSSLDSYRMIMLQEIPRKIITRELCNRMIKCLIKDGIIDDYQFCHPKRNIKDPLIALQMMISVNPSFHLTALDFQRAFDAIDHLFIIEMFKARGFPQNTINLISAFLKGKAVIEVNGYDSDPFDICRGMAQGDPFSPICFILVIDLFLRLIQNDPKIRGLNLTSSSSLSISYFCYADDFTLLFLKIIELINTLGHTETIKNITRMNLSNSKSELLSFGKKKLKEINGIPAKDQIRLLGVMFDENGVVNNLDKSIQEIIQVLTILKKSFPNFFTRVNCFK